MLPGRVDLRSSLKVAERDAFLKTLALTRWNVTEAAKRLGLPRRTVIYRMSRLGLRRPTR
jgi:transcriptional regulator with GAF, ATPase, and Fis domain